MKSLILKSGTLFSILLAGMMFYAGEAWGADVFTSNLDKTALTGATASFNNCSVADAPAWGTGYSKAYLTSSSSGYATITFDPAIDLSGYDDVQLTVHWGSGSGRPLYVAINGGSNTVIHESLVSADRSKVVDASCAITASTLTSIKLLSSGGSGVYFFDISITSTVACPATQPEPISKGTVSGGVITLTAGGTPAADNTWYWQDAADGTATTESGATKDVTIPGTYYIRSYHSSGCWSAATSVVVKAKDFGVLCPGTEGGELFSWTPKTGLVNADIDAGTYALPGSWLETLEGGEAELYVNSSGNMRIRNSELNYNSSDVYIHVTLDCEIQEGDIISINSSANANQIKITTNAIKPGKSGSVLAATITQGTDFIVGSGNKLIGETEFYLWRNSGGTNIGTVTITRPKTSATYTWTCPATVTQGSNTTISVSSDCSEPVTLAWTNGPIDGVSFNATTGELVVGSSVPLGTQIKINASNPAGACGETSETKTITVDLPVPTFVWTYDADVNAGARYPIAVTSPEGVSITLTLLDDPVPAGIATNITGNSGTYDVGDGFLGSTLTFQATSAANASYCAHTETKVVNVTTCFTDKMLYVTSAGYVNAGGSAKPRYYIEQTSVGRILKDFGSSSSSPSEKSATIDGHNFTHSVGSLSAMCINPYIDNVVKVRIYLYGSGSSRTVTGVYYSGVYADSKSKFTDITSGSRVEYESGTSFGSTNTYVDIYPSVLLNSMEYLYITFSGGANIYGADLVDVGGSESAPIAWSPSIAGNVVHVTEGDAPFTYTAAQSGSVQSLGTLTYSSSDTQVATVNPTTGEVTILDNGSSVITATLSASGCYAETEIYYRVEVKECKDDACVISAPKTTKCSAESITLTIADYEEGASIQWYRDGVLIPGETGETYTTTEQGAYQVVASKNCHQHSNIITITNLTAAPTITAIYDYYYIKNNLDDFHSLNLALFEVTNADVVSANFDVSSINCSLVIDDGKVYLRGKPEITANNTINPFTVTVTNSCNSLSANASMDLRLLAATAKPTVAWVVEGDKGGGFTDGIADGQGSGNALFDYLNTTGGYSLTAVNDYSTTNEKLIAQYYSQFDLIVMTDFPNSKTSDDDGKSYTNAVGSMIDKKPMLSMEAFVSAQPNWRISSNPYNPPTLQKKMKLLCAAHQIFDPAVEIGVYADGGNEYVNVLTNTSGTKTLQGFSPVSIPDFIFIATIDGGSYGELVTCCERQTVIQARFMILGIESTGMNAMEPGAKQMVKQILDYLLIADPLLIADCSLVFDNGGDGAAPGSGDHLWSNAANWGPNHGSLIPSPFHAVRIERPCQVDIADAHASSARLAHGTYLSKTYNGSLEVMPQGALSLTGFIKRTYNNDFLTRHPLESGDIAIRANATGNGALIWGDKEGDVPATVDFYSKATDAQTAHPVWQYIGSPFSTRMTALEQYYKAWMCRWSYISNPALGGTWTWVENDDRIDPFVGYTITQTAAKTYSWTAMLNKPEVVVVPLRYTADAEGFAMAANSWVAPINIASMETGDFDGADPTIYIFNTGTYKQYEADGTPGDATIEDKTGAGQYTAVPVNSAPYVGDSTIAPMQGFFVQTTRNGSLTLDYKKIVMDTVNFESTTNPVRAPKRLSEEESEEAETRLVPEVMRLNVTSQQWGDRLFLLMHPEFSDAYELGWEGRKQEGDERAPYLAAVEPSGEMAVAAIETPEGQYLSFRAGEDSIYTFSFDYEGETIYLYDRLADEAAEIRTGNTYTFRATNKTAAERFLITATPPRTPTQIETIGAEPHREDPEKIIHEGKLMILYKGAAYDALGTRTSIRKEAQR